MALAQAADSGPKIRAALGDRDPAGGGHLKLGDLLLQPDQRPLEFQFVGAVVGTEG